jgi:hypothetical protein
MRCSLWVGRSEMESEIVEHGFSKPHCSIVDRVASGDAVYLVLKTGENRGQENRGNPGQARYTPFSGRCLRLTPLPLRRTGYRRGSGGVALRARFSLLSGSSLRHQTPLHLLPSMGEDRQRHRRDTGEIIDLAGTDTRMLWNAAISEKEPPRSAAHRAPRRYPAYALPALQFTSFHHTIGAGLRSPCATRLIRSRVAAMSFSPW